MNERTFKANVWETFERVNRTAVAGLLSSVLQILEDLFFTQIFRICRIFFPFEGGRGDVKWVFSRIIGICTRKHPPSPLQKGELHRAKNQNIRKKF